MCECSMSVVCCYRTVADLTILHRVPYWITLWRELAGRSATKLRWGLPLQCTLLYHQVWLLSGEPACQTRHGVAHSLRCYLRQLKPQTGLHAEVTVSVILRNTNVTCGALGWHTRWLIFITTGLVRLESQRHARYGALIDSLVGYFCDCCCLSSMLTNWRFSLASQSIRILLWTWQINCFSFSLVSRHRYPFYSVVVGFGSLVMVI